MKSLTKIKKEIISNNIYRNIGLNIILKPVSLLISFFAVPITITYLGGFYYGLWSTILSIVSWFNFFDIGIGNGLRNKLTITLNSKDFTSAKSYVITSYIVAFFISICMLIISTILLFIFNWNDILNIYTINLNEIRVLFLINFAFLFINFILRINTNIFYALQQAAIVSLMQLINQILTFLGVFIILSAKLSNGIIYVSLIYGFSELIVNLIFTFYLFYKNTFLLPKFIYFDRSKVNNLLNLGIKFFFIQISAMVIFTTDNVIISNLFNPNAVTPYNITFKVFNLLIILHTIFITPLWSSITKAQEEKNYLWIQKIFKILISTQVFIIIGSFFILLNFNNILTIWLGRSSFKGTSTVLTLCFSMYAIIATWSNGLSYFMNGLGIMNIQIFVAIIQGLINIPLSIFFARNLDLGIAGVILGTISSLLISSIIYPTIILKYIKRVNRVS